MSEAYENMKPWELLHAYQIAVKSESSSTGIVDWHKRKQLIENELIKRMRKPKPHPLK